MSERISIRAYARHRGVSHTAVRKALASGRIQADSMLRIDPVAADQAWTVSTDLSKPRNSVTGLPKRRSAVGAPSGPVGEDSLEEASSRQTVDGLSGSHDQGGPALGTPTDIEARRLTLSYAASRAAREAYLARLAKLEFEERTGKLVDASQVRTQIFALGRRLRDALMGLPDRLAPVLAGQPDPAVVHRILSDEIRVSLSELSGAPPLTG